MIPAQLVADHSVIAEAFARPGARQLNVQIEYRRNRERYRFLKWGQAALPDFVVVPPGTGIMHQVNIEYLAQVVVDAGEWAYPDVCLGTDSHTTMVNGLGVLGWGIGGIEGEAVLLGQPLSLPLPPVVGFRLEGELPPGSTSTDLVLTVTQMLRRHGVVGKFVEFVGPGVSGLTVADRATIANMGPEYGSTAAMFAIDDETLRYLRMTGRSAAHVDLVERYAKEQGLWFEPGSPVRYSEDITLDLSTVEASLAGPRRPQDRVALSSSQKAFATEVGDERHRSTIVLDQKEHEIEDGAVAIAAITSCTNTSNPSVMVAAGLLARNAVRRGLTSKPWVKTTLSPGSRVVMDYYAAAGLTGDLEQLGFHLTGFGCMTCIGASGPLIPEVSGAAHEGVRVVSVLSGNRNFEGRINPTCPELPGLTAAGGGLRPGRHDGPRPDRRTARHRHRRRTRLSARHLAHRGRGAAGHRRQHRRDMFTGATRASSTAAPSGRRCPRRPRPPSTGTRTPATCAARPTSTVSPNSPGRSVTSTAPGSW